MSTSECRSTLKISVPIAFAYFPIGLVFGVIFVQSGYPWWLGVVMSILIFSGSAQFVALSMLQAGSSWWAIAFAVFFIAFRNSFYGLNFLHRYDTHWFKKGLLAMLLVDATYALLLKHQTPKGQDNDKFCLWLSFWNFSYWVGGTLVGALGSRWIPPFHAMEFVLPAFFLSVAVDYWIKLKEWHLVIAPIVASVVAYWMLPDQYLLLAIVLSLIIIMMIDKSKQNKLERRHA